MPSLRDLMVGPTEEEILAAYAGRPDKLLLLACKESNLTLAEAALNFGVSSKTKFDALIMVSKSRYIPILNLLMKNGVNIHNRKDEAMREAAYHGQLEVIKLLQENGCDIHIKNEQALAFAVSCHTNKGHLEVIKYLFANGANVELSVNNHSIE